MLLEVTPPLAPNRLLGAVHLLIFFSISWIYPLFSPNKLEIETDPEKIGNYEIENGETSMG